MHQGPITSVLASRDNKYVYTAGYDSRIFKWDRNTEESSLIGSHEHLINSLALSNDGSLLASCSSDYTINLYDTKTDTLVKKLYGHSDDVESVSFNSDNSLLVSTSRDKRCLVWSVSSGAIITQFSGHSKDVLSLWVHHDKAFTTGDDGRVLVWRLTDGVTEGEIGPLDCEIDIISGNEAHQVFAIGADDGTVLIFDAITFKKKRIIHAHKQGVKQVVFSPSGKYLLTAGYDHLIKIWDYEKGEQIKTLTPYQYQWERSLSWSQDEEFIFGASFGNRHCEWSVSEEKLISPNIELATPSINDFSITENETLVTASDDGKFRIQGKEILESQGVLTNGVSISKDGEYAVWGDHASKIHIVNCRSLECNTLLLNTGPVNSVYYNEFDQMFYIGTYGGYVSIINPCSAEETFSWKAHNGAVKAVQSDHNVIVTVSAGGSTFVFDKNNVENYKEFVGPNAIVNDVYLDSKRNQIVVVSRDKLVRIFDLSTGKVIKQHDYHRYSIKSVVVSDDGKIISGDYWGYCAIWNPLTDEVDIKRIADNGISALRSQDNYVYASSYDGGIYKFNSLEHVSEVLRLFEQFPQKEVIS